MVLLLAALLGFVTGKLRQRGFLANLTDFQISTILGTVLGALSVFIFEQRKDT